MHRFEPCIPSHIAKTSRGQIIAAFMVLFRAENERFIVSVKETQVTNIRIKKDYMI